MSSVSRARIASLILACATLASLAMAAAASAATKPYQVEFSPTALQAGGITTVTATVTNKAVQQSIGSIQFTAPAGVLIKSATPAAGLQSIPSGGARSVRWLNQAIVPGQTVTYTFAAQAPCSIPSPPAPGPWPWKVDAKQSNNFSGPPGNTFGPQTSSSLNATLAGTCAATLTWKAQPQDAMVDVPIGAVDFTEPPAPSVQVTAGGAPAAGVQVTARLVGVSGNGSLASASTRTVTTDASGIAQFTNLQVTSTSGSAAGYYKLEATVDNTLYVPSAQFLVQDQATPCPTAGCSGSTTGTAGSNVNVSVAPWSGTGAPGFLSLSVLTANGSRIAPDCSQWYTPFSSEFSLVLGPAGNTGGLKTITYTITAADMNSRPNNGAASIDVCYAQPGPAVAGTVKFGTAPGPWDADGDGNPDGQAWVLATCADSRNVPPCEMSTSVDSTGRGMITWRAPGGANDPMGRP